MMVHHHPGEPEGWCQLLASWQHARGVFGWDVCLVLWEPSRPGKYGVKIMTHRETWSWDWWRTLKPSPDAVNMSAGLHRHQDHTGGFGVNGTLDQKRCSTWVSVEYPGWNHEEKVTYPSAGRNSTTQRTSTFLWTILNCLLVNCKTVQKNYITNKCIL